MAPDVITENIHLLKIRKYTFKKGNPMNDKYKIIITTQDGKKLETTTEIELNPKNIVFVGHCGSGINYLAEAIKIQINCNIEPELDEFDKAGLKLSQEDKDKLTSVASRCGIDISNLINLLIANENKHKQAKLDSIVYSPYVANKSLKELMGELEKSVEEYTVKDLIHSKPKKQNWKKKRFWE